MLAQSILQHLRFWIELLEAQIILRAVDQRAHWHKTDNLRADNGNAIARRLEADKFDHAVERGEAVVRHIDRNLRGVALLEIDAHRLDAGQAAAGLANHAGNLVRN
ncbi:hypothetical protein SDC9_192277 [bioreactor metagenome]|uniref:Uncharacterized protein n=1 Tax=bioreactor metagenome TaxID=1076179 RepID=A0A645I1U6_9ZZZZ